VNPKYQTKSSGVANLSRILQVFIASLSIVGCGKNDSSNRSTENPASASQSLKGALPGNAHPLLGKWVTDSGHIIELRTDGRLTIEPFSGNQVLGTYSWNAVNKEILVNLSTRFGKQEALWQVQEVGSDSITMDVRDEQILGRRGKFKLVRYREGVPGLKAKGQSFSAEEGQPFEFQGEITFVNAGTGTLLINAGRNNFATLYESKSVSLTLDLKSDAREINDSMSKSVDYSWKKPSGEVLESRVECKVIIEKAKAKLLQLGKPVRNDPKREWEWFQFEIPSHDDDGNVPDSFAVVQTPTSKGQFFDADRNGNPAITIIRSFTPGKDYLAWIRKESPGNCFWRARAFERQQTLCLLPLRNAIDGLERDGMPLRPVEAGRHFILDGSECPERDPSPHRACWAAISFKAKSGRSYLSAFSNSAAKAGWDASVWFLSDTKYQQFKSVNLSEGIKMYASELLGSAYSTLNLEDVPLWTAPSDGRFWILFHYSKVFSSDHSKNDCGVWLYECPAYSQNEFTFTK